VLRADSGYRLFRYGWPIKLKRPGLSLLITLAMGFLVAGAAI